MKIEQDFDPADPGELQSYSFDFSNESSALAGGTDSISAAAWSLLVVSTVSGFTPDTDPASRLQGGPSFAGKITSQFLSGLMAGNRYRVQAIVTTALGETISLFSHVACLPLS